MSLLILILDWGPTLFLPAAYCAGAIFYFLPRARMWPARETFLALAWAVLGGRLFYAALASVGQFFLWTENDLTKMLLTLPAGDKAQTLLSAIPHLTESSFGYFLVYSWGRFWLNPLLTILVAASFYLFLRILKRRNARFFDEGETELGFFAALIAGWPGFVVFLPLVFAAVVFASLARLIALREALTTLGVPLLLAAGIALVWGEALVRFMGLWALIV